jgi:hypothetical protein
MPNTPLRTEAEIWAELNASERLVLIINNFTPQEWYGDMALPVLAFYRLKGEPGRWGQIKAQYKEIGGNPFDLEKEVDKFATLYERTREPAAMVVPSVEEPILPPRRVYAEPGAPILPGSAYIAAKHAEGACPWLEAYIAHSKHFAPWGMEGAHQAVGLWVLSTMAARRVFLALGPSEVYPSLFLAMIAESTLYSKSTTALIGMHILEWSGGSCFLAADHSTPQALLRSMSGVVPHAYGHSNDDARESIRSSLGFAAQRGWYFDEWGHLLPQLRRPDSAMSGFHSFLRILDDGRIRFKNDTIQRGVEAIEQPYLSLLTAATENDLAPFTTPGASWWRDGFYPRFAFITPQPDEAVSLSPFPAQKETPPGHLVAPLHTWHVGLGIPSVAVEESLDGKTGKPTGVWQATIAPLQRRELGISPAARDAYEAYLITMRTMLTTGVVPRDFFASYARLHTKAIRIALLLASFQGCELIELRHWAYAQAVVESWRMNLHTLVDRVAHVGEEPAERKDEERIVHILTHSGQATARELQRHIKGMTSERLIKTLGAMEKIGRIFVHQEGKKALYTLLSDEEGAQQAYNEYREQDVPPF